MDDHGVRRGDTGQILARSRRPVASRVALDLPYWVMRSAPYRLIRMAIEMACEAGAYFSFVDFMSCITIAKLVHLLNLWLTSKSMNRLITNYEAVYLSNG